jgi:hypothetical protein
MLGMGAVTVIVEQLMIAPQVLVIVLQHKMELFIQHAHN